MNDPMGVHGLNARINIDVIDRKRGQLATDEVARLLREIQRLQIAANGLAVQLRSASIEPLGVNHSFPTGMRPNGPVEQTLQATRDWIVSLVECQAYIAEVLGAYDAFFRVKILNERAAEYGLQRARTDLGLK